ncbi:MAG: hypothetical protein ACOC0Z_00105 [Halohasta sp.]
MLDLGPHGSLDHPNLWWIVVPSLLSLLAGIAIGLRSRAERLRGWLRARPADDR